jgi:hypothetical protein
MEEMIKNIGFDIVSGLVTSLVIFLGTVVTKYWLIPLIKRLKYSGANVSGEWHCQSVLGNATYVYTFNIRQNAHDLKGNATILKRYNGAIEYNQAFKLSGAIYEGYVILNLKSADRESLSFSTGIFQLQDRGNLLSGILSYRVRIGNGVSSENISFYRA